METMTRTAKPGHKRRSLTLFVASVTCVVMSPNLTWAQQTRAEETDLQRAIKTTQLQHYEPGKLEAALYRIEDQFLLQRVFSPSKGIFARVGGLPEGAGLTVGPGYRYSTHDLSFTASSAISIRGSWEVDARLAFPPATTATRARQFVSVGAHYRNLPQENFYGLGGTTPSVTRTSYALRETSVDATGGVSPLSWFTMSGTAEYRADKPGQGQSRRLPSIEELFSSETAPGLDADIDFLRFGGKATIDYTKKPDGTVIGGRYSASYDKYSDRELDGYSFGRWDVELEQFVPIRTSARLIALRAHVAGTSPDDGNDVPFYLQPTLGGSDSLRGYSVARFRDRYSLLLQSEYRWRLNSFMTGALFYDTGTVASRRSDLNLNDLQDDYGFALRFGFQSVLAMRTEVVFGGDAGTVIAVRFGNVF